MTALPKHPSKFCRQGSGGVIRQHHPRHDAPLVAEINPCRQSDMAVDAFNFDTSGKYIQSNDWFGQRRGRIMLSHQVLREGRGMNTFEPTKFSNGCSQQNVSLHLHDKVKSKVRSEDILAGDKMKGRAA